MEATAPIRLVEDLLTAAREMPRDELPELLGQLRVIEATAMARLAPASTRCAPESADRLLDVEEAAGRLNVSQDFLYRNWKRLPFARKYPFGLRFSESGVNSYIRDG
jgi:hypothetical protein